MRALAVTAAVAMARGPGMQRCSSVNQAQASFYGEETVGGGGRATSDELRHTICGKPVKRTSTAVDLPART